MQTILSFETATNPYLISTDYAAYKAFQDVHHKTHILRGKWSTDKVIARAKRFGAVEGTIRVKHAEIYASKEWQRFEQEVARA